jgi:hypothetical protein
MVATRLAFSSAGQLLVVGLAALSACGDAAPRDGDPIDVKVWVQQHGPLVASLRARLDAAAALVRDLPATSVHVADPAVPLLPIEKWEQGENAVMISGVNQRGFPEFGRDDGKDLQKGETSVSACWTGYVDFASAYAMVDSGDKHYLRDVADGVGLAKKLAKVRFVIFVREVSFEPGTIDKDAKTFTAGTYEGVAHVADLEGPKHLGSVRFAAQNTGRFESYSGSEEFMLRADLGGAAVRALYTEMSKVLPRIVMPVPHSMK